MHGLKKIKTFLAILSTVSLLLIIFVVKFQDPKMDIKNNSRESELKFNQKEQKIVNSIYKKIDSGDYFDSNLKSFEIKSLQLYGYYKSKSNELYIKVNYSSECKDGTYNCDNLANDKDYSISNNIPFYFFIIIDVDDYNVLEIIDGISAHINSDWLSTSSKIE